jgi:hypothetical protein
MFQHLKAHQGRRTVETLGEIVRLDPLRSIAFSRSDVKDIRFPSLMHKTGGHIVSLSVCFVKCAIQR